MKFYQRDLKAAMSRRWTLTRTEFIFYEYLTDVSLFEEVPLTETAVKNICPVLNEEDQRALDNVLSKFFYRDSSGCYHSIESETIIQKRNELSEKRQRAINTRWLNQRNNSNEYSSVNTSEYSNANTNEYSSVNTSEYSNANTNEYSSVNTSEYSNANTNEYSNVNTNEYSNVNSKVDTHVNTKDDSLVDSHVNTRVNTSVDTSEYSKVNTNNHLNAVAQKQQNTSAGAPSAAAACTGANAAANAHTNEYSSVNTSEYSSVNTNEYTNEHSNEYTNVYSNVGTSEDTNEYSKVNTNVDTSEYSNEHTSESTSVDTHVQNLGAGLDNQRSQNQAQTPVLASKPAASRVGARDISKKYIYKSDTDTDTDKENLKSIKSVSVSESVSDISSEIKKINTREKLKNSELEKVLVALGLSKNALIRWKQNNPKRFEALLGHVETMDFDDLQSVFSRCQKAKDKENKPLANAVAFVVTALERQTQENKNRRYEGKPKTMKPEKDFRKIDYTQGLYLDKNGDWRVKPDA